MEKTQGRRVYHRRAGRGAQLGEREKRRLVQLGVCAVLFLTVFLARGLDRLAPLREELAAALRGSADFRSAFVDLGWSVASGQPVGKTLESLWTDVFAPAEKSAPAAWQGGAVYHAAQKDLRVGGAATGALAGTPEQPQHEDPLATSGIKPVVVPEPTPEPEVVRMDYTGPALPDNTTMDRYALGLSETVSPVLGRMTSEFGWREHPIEGGEKFHCGVDLKADEGTTVAAFAAGKVDYIGESDVYGQYLQLRHDNGVTTFYAHCSKLCVQKGQTVAAGEKVAESGATGEVTGPHLHFEMKKDGVRLNPAYYIDTLA